MPDTAAVVEQRTQFGAKQKQLQDVFELARDGSKYDFSRPKVLEALGAADSKDAVEKVQARNRELNDLGESLRLAELKNIESQVIERDAERSNAARATASPMHPTEPVTKSFGQLFTEHKAYKAYRESQIKEVPAELDISLKTLFQTTAGFPPESIRTGRVVEAAVRPIQVLDLIPITPQTQAVEKYMEETTRTAGAVETAEAGTFAESTFAFTERTSNVRKITDSLPVTDEQLEDELQVQSLVDQRLRFQLMQRLDGQVLTGNGSAPNLRGLLDSGFITQTQAKGNDPVFDAFFKALTLVRYTGRAQPSAAIFHPTDWQNIRLTRTADGIYIMGAPNEPGATTLFGLPIAISDACTVTNAIVGDFVNFSRIGERRGVTVQVGYSGTQFVEGKLTIRADMRACFTIYRINAFTIITGL